MIFESHAHYDDDKFEEDRDILLKSLPENGIGTVVNVSSSMETAKRTIELTQQYPFLYGSVGVHPEECADMKEEDLSMLKTFSANKKIVAIGEIGLDYYWDEPQREIQKKWFAEQIELAREVDLPMIIHSRDAACDTLTLLKEHDAHEIGGVIHCFSYSVEIAKEFLAMGFYLGLGGVITFSNAKKLKEVAFFAPAERILLETDCPYLAPVPNRGKRNSSLNLIYIADEIARIRGITREEVIEQTEKNAKEFYRIPKTEMR